VLRKHPLHGLAACRPGPEFTDNIAITAAGGDEAPPTQHYFDPRSVVRAGHLDDALPADRKDTFTEHLAGCAEYPAGSAGRSAP
jgi:hypothetical protein